MEKTQSQKQTENNNQEVKLQNQNGMANYSLTNIKQSNSTLYITYLNILACFAVVALHANGIFWAFSKTGTWISANFLECLFYFAVPIFFMCSGATLLNYRERYSTKHFFIKRVYKTVIPYIIWSCISILLGYFVFKTMTYENVTSIRWLIDGFCNGTLQGIYWFFIPLFAFYLCVPFLSLISPNDENKQKQVFKYIIIVGFIFNMALPLVFRLLKLNYSSLSNVNVVFGYVLYGVTGFYINKFNIEKKWRIFFYVVGILGFFLHFFGTWYLSFRENMIVDTFKGYLNAPCFVFSISIFLLFKNINFDKLGEKFNKFSKSVASTTFGIYLIHDIFLQIIRGTAINIYSIWFRTLGAVVLFVFCVLLVKLIQMIPKVGKTLFP